jgi:hypothetical protein
MRLLSSCSAALLALVMLMVACNTVDPSECWPNTSGGFGGTGTIPIGAGVGVSSGDFISPRWGPLGYPAPANPCVSSGDDMMTRPGAPAGDTTSAGTSGAGGGHTCAGTAGGGDTYVYCDDACMAQCTPAPAMGAFSSSIFKFVTTIPLGTRGEPGGWQVASVTLKFDRWVGILPETWTCSITIGMPLETTVNGTITAAYAASISADVATTATSYLMHDPSDPPPGIFCSRLPDAMNSVFTRDPVYKTIGARVTK